MGIFSIAMLSLYLVARSILLTAEASPSIKVRHEQLNAFKKQCQSTKDINSKGHKYQKLQERMQFRWFLRTGKCRVPTRLVTPLYFIHHELLDFKQERDLLDSFAFMETEKDEVIDHLNNKEMQHLYHEIEKSLDEYYNKEEFYYSVGGLKKIARLCPDETRNIVGRTGPIIFNPNPRRLFERVPSPDPGIQCFNALAPEPPSILRSLRSSYPTQTDPNAFANPSPLRSGIDHYLYAPIPHGDPSNDGRLIRGDETGLKVFRPENVDFQHHSSTEKFYLSNNISGNFNEGNFRLFLTDQTDIDLTAAQGIYFPEESYLYLDRTQPSLCDGSSSNLSAEKRNPRKCFAKITAGSDALTSGDCYNLGLFERIDLVEDRPGEERKVLMQELWSFQFTVFIPAAKTSDAGRPFYFPANEEEVIPWHHDLIENLFWLWETGQDDQELVENLDRIAPVPRKDEIAHRSMFLFNRLNRSAPTSPNIYDLTEYFGANCQGCFYWDGSGGLGPNEGKNFNFFEPDFTGDGKILILNTMSTLGGVVYAYDSSGSCRADKFNIFKPISYFPVDERVNTQYGLGQFGLFRDLRGDEILPGDLIEGTYPWIDREGRMMTFALRNKRPRDLFDYEMARPDHYFLIGNQAYTAEEIQAQNIDPHKISDHIDEEIANHNIILGAWTNGKMVYLDTIINPGQFSGRAYWREGEKKHAEFNLNLYNDPAFSYNFTAIRPTSIQSTENVFFYYPQLAPNLPFELVWFFQSNNNLNGEIYFDDFVTEELILFINGNPLIDLVFSNHISDPKIQDGSSWTESGYYVYQDMPLLQNAATKKSDEIPPYAYLKGGARIEPVRDGGVLGQAIFLDGVDDRIEVPNILSDENFSLGQTIMFWLDQRDSDLGQILQFPDHSRVLISKEQLHFIPGVRDELTKIIKLPPAISRSDSKYHHFIFHFFNHPRKHIDIYINGNFWNSLYFDTELVQDGKVSLESYQRFFSLEKSRFPKASQVMTIGKNKESLSQQRPVRGWIDEIKIISGKMRWNRESRCNHALGTIVKLEWSDRYRSTPIHALFYHALLNYQIDSGPFCEQLSFGDRDERGIYSYWTPTEIAPQKHKGRVCINKIHTKGDFPFKERCQRNKYLTPEDMNPHPLTPFPDFGQNSFCLNCHTEHHSYAPLGVDALWPSGHARFLDKRRRPSDPPSVISGQRPQGPLFREEMWDYQPALNLYLLDFLAP